MSGVIIEGADNRPVGVIGNQLVVSSLTVVTASFVRPADTVAYAANDVVSNSTTVTTPMTLAGMARTPGGSGYVVGARLATNLKSIVPAIRVHLFNASTATLSGDNLPMQTKYVDLGTRLQAAGLPAAKVGQLVPAGATWRQAIEVLRPYTRNL